MTFSKEDKAAWLDSEVMSELEKLSGDVLNGPPAEAFQPIKHEESTWEEENLEEQLVTAVDKFNEPTFEEEIHIAYNKSLFKNLEKVAHNLSDKSNIKAAYRVERSLNELKALLREGK
jgi:hypothetical protein